MKKEIQEYLTKFDEEANNKFNEIYNLIYESVLGEVEEKLWAKIPSFYLGDKFIRIIPFKDHLNIEAKEVIQYKEELKEYKITPKGMLQIYYNQDIPVEVLKKIFKDTLI